MRLRRSTIAALFRLEMRMLLRDRRTILTSIVLPLIVMPIMLFGQHWTQKKRELKVSGLLYRYAVIGAEAEHVRALLEKTRARLDARADPEERSLRMTEVESEDPAADLDRNALDFYVEGLTAEQARARDRSTDKPQSSAKPKRSIDGEGRDEQSKILIPGVIVSSIVYRGDRDTSATGSQRLFDALIETRRLCREELLVSRGFPTPPEKVAVVVTTNVAASGQVAGLALGRMITLILLLFILTGGMVVATDTLAGEKERGTLETLLTTAASRIEIVAAKHLVILAVALTITLIQAVNFLVYIGLKLIPVPAHLASSVPPSVALLLFVLYLPVASLYSGVLLFVSGHAKTYKEAQIHFFPVFLVGLLPALAPFLPGLPLRSAIVIVPVAGIAMAVKEILVGAFDWPMIAIAWLVTVAAAAWTVRLSVRSLSAERLITSADQDAIDFEGGPSLFPRHVLRWFALLWALLLIVNNYMMAADIRVQLAVNLLVLFFGATLWMIRRYRLDPREALALRPVRPIVWPAVIVAAPAGLLFVEGFFRLISLVLPIAPENLQSFQRALLPKHVPDYQLLLFFSLLPGVFEELLFRGVLLHGLRRRFHPAALSVINGAVFGLFHVALFRLAPTALLGALLAAVTLLTGSIFPAMLWHALNNALGIMAARYLPGTDALPVSTYLAGAGILAASFWVLWRNRTPYSDMKKSSARRSTQKPGV